MVLRTALIASLVFGVGGCGFESPEAAGPEVSFVVEQSLTDETVSSIDLIVRLAEPAPKPAEVKYEVTGGSAMAGADFDNGQGVVKFDVGEDQKTFSLTIIDDGIEELEEDIRVVLRSPKNAVIGAQPEHRVRISANKLPRVSFVASTSMANEPAGTQTFVVQLDTLAKENVVVRYALSGTAKLADHGLADSFLVIPANQITGQIAAVVVNDPTDEFDETVELTLIAQEGAVVAPGLGGHVHTILDDDLPPPVRFEVITDSVAEGGTTATLSVTLGLASEKPISIDYAATGGTAAGAGADYTLAAGTLAFPAGVTAQTVTVAIENDALDEDDENLQVTLSNPSNTTVQTGAGVHTLTITDDDNAPSIEFAQASSNVGEATATQTVNVSLSAPSGRAIQFSLSRAGSTGTDDLTIPGSPFTIAAGTTSVSFNATILNDSLDEDDETAALTLTTLVNAGAGGQMTHTITVQDNDNPPSVRFDPATPNQSDTERNQTYTYRVILSAASGRQVTVPIAVTGSAENEDYDIGANDIPVVFAPGQTSKDVRVIVIDDAFNEPNDTVVLTLGTATNATNDNNNQARTHTITN